MNTSLAWFEDLVARDWTVAVFEAAARFDEARPVVVEALSSASSEVRSAAVAVLNEANDSEAHGLVSLLEKDPDAHVREEVLEYIEQFPRESDKEFLLMHLVAREHMYLASSGLRNLLGPVGPLITDDEANASSEQVAHWVSIVRRTAPDA